MSRRDKEITIISHLPFTGRAHSLHFLLLFKNVSLLCRVQLLSVSPSYRCLATRRTDQSTYLLNFMVSSVTFPPYTPAPINTAKFLCPETKHQNPGNCGRWS